MLRFEGERVFPQPPDEVFARLTDPRFLAGCVPDVETVKEASPEFAALVLRPNLAFVRGTLDVSIRLGEKNSPKSAGLLLTGKGIGSSSVIVAGLAFTPEGTGTRVGWVAEVKELGGLLKMVPHGLIRGAAGKVIGEAWAAVAARMGGQ